MKCSSIKPNINNITFSAKVNKRVNKNYSNSFSVKAKEIPRKSIIGLTFLVALGGILAKNKDYLKAIPFNAKPYSTNEPTQWDPAFKTIASSSQEHFSMLDYYINDFGEPKYTGYYTKALINELKKPEIRTIQQANDVLLSKGYDGTVNFSLNSGIDNLFKFNLKLHQFPVESGSQVDMWDKKDHSKHRFMIIIGGNDGMADTENVLDKFQEIYNVPEFNIYNIEQANTEDIKEVIETVSQQIKHYGRNNSEVLLYYNGHGDANGWQDTKKEGDAQAYFKIDEDKILEEKTLRKLLNKKFKGIKSCIIFDTCHSGAWISKNDTKKIERIG